MIATSQIVNAFTVDVEDYFHVAAFASQINRTDWDNYECRVVDNTQRVLRLLEQSGTRATFFVLGWVADRFPGLVREIHRAGHEIGNHSYWHRNVYDLQPEEFRKDLREANDVLQDLIGEPVTAYRAPSFSITNRSLWALDILAEEGFRYDSSIFPVVHDRYGIADAPRFPYRADALQQNPDIWEFPPSVHRFCRMNIPMAGGGYFRLFPLKMTTRCLSRINSHSQQPFMFYIHPWEVDPHQPRLQGSWRSKFRHYQNLHSTEAKLTQLLQSFRFGSLTDALNPQISAEQAA